MDIKKRQEAPADLKEQSIQTKLKRRDANISKYLWSKRNPTNPLKGYNLSLCKRRRKIKFKRCWECGSTTHLKANCPIHIKHQLMARVQELEALVQELSEKIHIQIKSRKRREFKRKKKLRKKKEKRRQRKIRAMNKAVKIKQYLLKEEETLNGISVTRGAKILEEASRAERQRIITAYEELYSTNIAADIGEAFCLCDEFFEAQTT